MGGGLDLRIKQKKTREELGGKGSSCGGGEGRENPAWAEREKGGSAGKTVETGGKH